MALEGKRLAIPIDDEAEPIGGRPATSLDLAAAVMALERKGVLVFDPPSLLVVNLTEKEEYENHT